MTEVATATRPWAFYRYLVGLSCDLVGDQVWFVALAWAAAQATDPATAGLVVAVGTVPRMLLLLPAGVIVDRLGALPVAQAAQVIRVLTSVATVLVAAFLSLDVGLLAAIAFVFGIADAARLPAAGALPPSLLPAAELVKGQGLIATSGRLATVAGGPASGIALAAGGLMAAASVNAVLFCLAFLTFRTLPRASTSRRSRNVRSGLRAGLSYVVGRRHVLALLVVVAALNLAMVGPLNLGLALRVQAQAWGPGSLGLLIGVYGAAAAVGSLVLVRVGTHHPPALVGLWWVVLSATAVATAGALPSVALTAAAVAVAGLALGPAGAILIGLIQGSTDEAYLGRVMSLVRFATIGLAPLAIGGFGQLANAVGLSMAFAVTGSVVFAVAVVSSLLPSLRRLTISDRDQPDGDRHT